MSQIVPLFGSALYRLTVRASRRLLQCKHGIFSSFQTFDLQIWSNIAAAAASFD